MVKRAKVGDVLELIVPDGLIYLHYIGTHPEYGDGVNVCPVLVTHRASVTESLFQNGYVVFYPVRTAVSRGLVKIVGQLPSHGLSIRLRRPGARIGNQIETWIIEENSIEEVKYHLSDDELKLPVAVIWNHEMLVQRVVDGWRPENEGRQYNG